MHILLLITVVAALASAGEAPREPVSSGAEKLMLAVCGIVAVALFARAVAVTTCLGLRRDFARCDEVLLRFRRWRFVHLVLWLGLVTVILFVLQWATLVRSNLQMADAFLIDDLLIVTPVLLPLLLSWAAYYSVDNEVHLAMARQAGLAPDPLGCRRYVLLHIRHYFGLLFLPLILASIVHDVIQWTAPALLHSDHVWVIYLLPFGGMVVFFPWLLRAVWQTEPLPPGDLRQRLQCMNVQCGVRPREILIWRSGGMITNAAVAGVLPLFRYVFLSDGLLSRLSKDQVLAIYAHELGHVRHRHLLLRLLAIVLPLPIWQACSRWLPEVMASCQTLLEQSPIGKLDTGILAVMMLGVYVMTAFAWYSRQLELQADLSACQLLSQQPVAQHRVDSEAVVALDESVLNDTVRRYTAALDRLTPARRRNGRSGFLHPTLQPRIEFLRRTATDVSQTAAFHRRQRLYARGLVAVVALSVIASLL